MTRAEPLFSDRRTRTMERLEIASVREMVGAPLAQRGGSVMALRRPSHPEADRRSPPRERQGPLSDQGAPLRDLPRLPHKCENSAGLLQALAVRTSGVDEGRRRGALRRQAQGAEPCEHRPSRRSALNVPPAGALSVITEFANLDAGATNVWAPVHKLVLWATSSPRTPNAYSCLSTRCRSAVQHVREPAVQPSVAAGIVVPTPLECPASMNGR